MSFEPVPASAPPSADPLARLSDNLAFVRALVESVPALRDVAVRQLLEMAIMLELELDAEACIPAARGWEPIRIVEAVLVLIKDALPDVYEVIVIGKGSVGATVEDHWVKMVNSWPVRYARPQNTLKAYRDRRRAARDASSAPGFRQGSVDKRGPGR